MKLDPTTPKASTGMPVKSVLRGQARALVFLRDAQVVPGPTLGPTPSVLSFSCSFLGSALIAQGLFLLGAGLERLLLPPKEWLLREFGRYTGLQESGQWLWVVSCWDGGGDETIWRIRRPGQQPCGPEPFLPPKVLSRFIPFIYALCF